MANGLIIYKDLFEQKGPILYLIHAIAYIISNTTFFGVFIFEIIAFSIFLYFVNKIISIYFRKIHFLWSTPLVSFIILSNYVFISGDSAEEFCLPLLAISLYYMLNYYKNIYPEKMPTKQIIINGIIAGCVLCIKYNLLAFWLGFAGFLCIGLLINKKVRKVDSPNEKSYDFFYAIKTAVLSGIYFLLGMTIPVIPWIIYFAINNALYDVIDVYFIVNITAYSTQTNIINRILTALSGSLIYIRNSPLFSGLTLIGYIYIMIDKTIIPNKYGKIALTLTILISVIGVYYGANQMYYFLILMAFIVLGLIFLARLIEKYISKKILYITPIYIILIVILCCMRSPNYQFHKTDKNELVQYQFAEIIENKPNATLLNYGFLDGGFYTVTNIVPNTRHFHKPNIEYEKYPQIMDEQNRCIKEALVDFVVAKFEKEEDSYNIPYLYENYNEIKTVYVDNEKSYYKLFQLK